jgi:hypothetical protein
LVGSFGRRSRIDGVVIADRSQQRMTQGSAEQAKGKVKEVAGKLTGSRRRV